MPVYDFRKIVSESYRVLLISVVIGLSAGYLLDFYSGRGQITALTLAMVPPVNGIGGNIGSILGARLSSALHLGILTPELKGQGPLKSNLIASISLGSIVFALVGCLFFFSSLLTGYSAAESLRVSMIFFGAGMLLTGIVALTSLMSAFLSYRYGVDPDNVVIPVVTTVVDVVGIISLLIMVHIIGV